MPVYELVLILKDLPKKDIVNCLKKAADQVWKRNGVINKIEFLGFQKLPFKRGTGVEGQAVSEGNYFLLDVSMNATKRLKLKPEFKLSVDIAHFSIIKKDESLVPADYKCTLEEELQKPALRKSVTPLLDELNVRAQVRR